MGGALLYVLVLWGVISLFLSLVVVLFGSSVSTTHTVKGYLQGDYLQKNILSSVLARYSQNSQDYELHTQQEGFTHTVTRFSDKKIIEVNANIDAKKEYYYEFHRDQREIQYVDPVTGDISKNNLEEIQNWEIYWDMKTDQSNVVVQQYNPLQVQESTDLRVTLIKFGAQTSKKCFDTSASDVTVVDPGVLSAFQKKIVLDELYFKSSSLTEDCDELDPDDDSLLLNSNGVLPLDFDNNRYILKVESLSGATHVQVLSVGNDSYIPTEYVYVDIVPDFEGVSVDGEYFIGGVNSAVFTYLTSAERTIDLTIHDDQYALDFDNWQYFLGLLVNKY